jgi:hypothetical protein
MHFVQHIELLLLLLEAGWDPPDDLLEMATPAQSKKNLSIKT